MLTRRPGSAPGDGGFTLIELLLAITILGVIMLPLGNVVIGFVRNSGATADRLALSHDAQMSAGFFARDVAAVGRHDYSTMDSTGNFPTVASIQLDAAYNTGGLVCGSATTPAAKVRFLSDDWDPATKTVSTDIVAYYLLSTVDGTELHRIRCTGGSTTGSDAVMARDVVPVSVTVTCSSTCTAATLPATVTLAFTVNRTSVGDYPITLTGQRRET